MFPSDTLDLGKRSSSPHGERQIARHIADDAAVVAE
jgi:hypothetical protein